MISLLFSCFLSTPGAFAQNAEKPKVGRKAAEKYFEKEVTADPTHRSQRGANRVPAEEGEDRERLLMLSVGTHLNSTSYAWKGSDKRTEVGRSSYGVTYMFDDYYGMDFNLRLDFNEYKLDEIRATKFSILPLLTFPKMETRFPLYFGFGLGLGVFFQQVEQESSLALDYQLLGGARFMDLFDNFGFFIELAMKNHLHLLSDGQLNGTTLTVGGVFTF